MKKRIIAIALIAVMLLALTACGNKEESASPAEQAAAEQNSGEVIIPEADPEVTFAPAEGVEPDSGIHTFTSDVNGISFDYDSKYIAMQNPAGNANIYAGDDTELPFCTVSIIPAVEASQYLRDMAAAAETELGKDLVTAASEPAVVDFGGRNIYYIYYTFEDADVDGVVACAYYAENLDDGSIVVYNSTSPEGDSDAVNSILKLAIETFRIADGDKV